MRKIFYAISAFIIPLAARAQDLGQKNLGSAQTAAGYQSTDIETLVGMVITTFLSLLGVIFLILIVYGGYLWFIARGDESKIEKARATITNSIIGLIIVLAAYAITYFVIDKLIAGTVKV
jgi:hypothetical protein